MRIVVVGSGQIGSSLASALVANGHSVVIIERDRRVCAECAKKINAVFICGDGTNIQTLTEAECDKADVFVALSERDQDNLVACQLAARRFRVPRTIARVNNPKNESLFMKLGGVSVAVSTAGLISSLIEEKVSIEDIVTLLTFKQGQVALVQVEIGQGSPAVGKAIVDLDLPADCVIISIIRGEQIVFPRGSTTLEIGDRVLALTRTENKTALQERL